MSTTFWRRAAAVAGAALFATAASAPHLFLPAPPMLSRQGRLGAILLLGIVHVVLFAALLCAVSALPRRAAQAFAAIAASLLVLLAALASVWSDEIGFTIAGMCLAASVCPGMIADSVMHTLNVAAHPNAWSSILAAGIVGALAWGRGAQRP